MFCYIIKYLTHIKVMLHKFNKRLFKDGDTLSNECYMHTIYTIKYVQSMFDIQKCTFFKLQYVSRGELPTPKGVIPKILFVVLEEYHSMHPEK